MVTRGGAVFFCLTDTSSRNLSGSAIKNVRGTCTLGTAFHEVLRAKLAYLTSSHSSPFCRSHQAEASVRLYVRR
jgi:hypothetical protein